MDTSTIHDEPRCCRCHKCQKQQVVSGTGFVLYARPGDRDRHLLGQTVTLWQAHGECIADEVAEGKWRRVSSFGFEAN